MAATVDIKRWTGPVGTPVKTTITSINTRANAYDTHSTGDTTNPILIPSTGTNYSYWVVARLSASVTPTGSITNIKWYSDGANGLGTGVSCLGNSATGYVQATGTAGVTGAQLTTAAYATLAAAPTDVFAFTSTATKAIAGTLSNPTTGDFGDLFVYQMNVINTAGAGATPTETFTWQYDET